MTAATSGTDSQSKFLMLFERENPNNVKRLSEILSILEKGGEVSVTKLSQNFLLIDHIRENSQKKYELTCRITSTALVMSYKERR